MKIVAIKKIGSKYKIVFDNNDYIMTYDNVILENNLLYDKNINDELFLKIKDETKYFEVYNSILKKLSKRCKSEWEVRQELINNDISENDVNKIIDKLKSLNLINDLEYALAYTNDRINLSLDGPFKIRKNLELNKVDEVYIETALEKFSKEIIFQKLNKIIDKKLSFNSKDTDYIFKQKMCLYLSNLGYCRDDIISCLDNICVDNKKLEKEMEKIFDKLKKKYNGYDLKVKLKQKLFSKGFSNDEISEFINKNSSLI